jgi:hypothetical protein
LRDATAAVADAIPDSRTVVLSDVGHGGPTADSVTSAVLDFLSESVDPAGTGDEEGKGSEDGAGSTPR